MADNYSNRLSDLTRRFSGESRPLNALAELDAPATTNLNMLAQALRGRSQPRKQLDLQSAMDAAAMGLGPVPIVGDVLGLAADASRYINDPSSRTPLNFGLTALGALPFVPPASAIFGGVLAKTANLDKKAIAEGMEKAGRSRDDIWKETGWFKGPEGKWKFEIDDSGALFNPSKVNGVIKENDLIVGQPNFDYGPTVGGLLEHGALKSAYPDGLTKSTFVGNKNSMFGDGVQGSYSEGRLTINAPAKSVDAKSTTLHELQHAIQEKEGFQRGGSVIGESIDIGSEGEKLSKRVKELEKLMGDAGKKGSPKYVDFLQEWQDLKRKITERQFGPAPDPYDNYRRLAGEAEARAVQSRMNMNPQQRQATPPWQSYDVPWEQLIVR